MYALKFSDNTDGYNTFQQLRQVLLLLPLLFIYFYLKKQNKTKKEMLRKPK